jgi:DNA-binding winged helix-turn-helix (wHTH) protein
MGATAHLLFSPYRLDLQNERLWRGDELIVLRAKPFALLRFMAENPARLLLHQELRKAIWPNTYVSEGVLRVYLREVRAALEDDPESPRFIETIARRGYRILAAVERITSAGTSAPIASATSESIATPAIVGRNAELARIRGAFAKASLGARQIVFLSGEAGIGKTAILEAFLNEGASSDDTWIGRGQCVEHRGESEPYLPVLDALASPSPSLRWRRSDRDAAQMRADLAGADARRDRRRCIQRSAQKSGRRQPDSNAARDGRCARAVKPPARRGAGVRGSALE